MQTIGSQVAQVMTTTDDEARGHGKSYSFQKGQRVFYEGEEAEIIRTNPLFVIKTKNRVVCGALRRQCQYIAANSITQLEC